MFDALKNFIAEISGVEPPTRRFDEEDYRLAAVALLVHVANVDGNTDLAERRRLKAIIGERFGLDTKATAELIATAEQSDREAVDFYHFTSVLKRALDDDGRQKIVEMLWDIAYADCVADEFEENTIWRIAELLGVSTRDRVLLRKRVAGRGTQAGPFEGPWSGGRGEGQSMSEAVPTDTGTHPSTDAQPRSGAGTRRVTVITGASGGIGADLARVFARHGHDLVLIARSGAALEALADEISVSGRPRPLVLVFDLLERNATDQIAAALEAASVSPEILVNNAGFGLIGPAEGLDPAEQLAIIDLNIRAVVALTLRLLPAIRAARGKILNIASIAPYFPGGPGMAAYYASKAFILSFSLALSQELRAQGVTVSALCPAYTKTGFQARAGIGPNIDLTRLPGGSSAMEVAEAGYAGLIAGRREIVPGFVNKLSVLALPFLPKAVVLAAISRLQQNRSPLR